MTSIVVSLVMALLARNWRASASLNGSRGMSAMTGRYSPQRFGVSGYWPEIVVTSVSGRSPYRPAYKLRSHGSKSSPDRS